MTKGSYWHAAFFQSNIPYNAILETSAKQQNINVIDPISIRHVAGAMIAWAFGIFVSILAFMFEIGIKETKKRQQVQKELDNNFHLKDYAHN
jgi:hypothetical protein